MKGRGKRQGTWVHPDIALYLSTWLDAEIAYAVTQIVKTYMAGKTSSHDPELLYIHKSVLDDTGKAVVWISPEGWTSAAPYHGGIDKTPGTMSLPGNSRHYLLTVIGGVPQAPVLIDEGVLTDFVNRAYPENMLLRRRELVEKIARVKEIAQVASTDINLMLKPLEMRAQNNISMAQAFQDLSDSRFNSLA